MEYDPVKQTSHSPFVSISPCLQTQKCTSKVTSLTILIFSQSLVVVEESKSLHPTLKIFPEDPGLPLKFKLSNKAYPCSVFFEKVPLISKPDTGVKIQIW